MLHVTTDVPGVACSRLETMIERALSARGRCRIGLSGGATPGPILQELGRRLPAEVYPRLLVTWVDERQDEASNYALARRFWLDDAPPFSRVLPMTDLERFRAGFVEDFDGGLDVALLGAGPDGHIASLFPGHAALDSGDALVVLVSDSPKPPPVRLTLTLAVLQACPGIVLAAVGSSKAAVLSRAYFGDETLPLGRLSPDGDYHWVLDSAAAGEIPADEVVNHGC